MKISKSVLSGLLLLFAFSGCEQKYGFDFVPNPKADPAPAPAPAVTETDPAAQDDSSTDEGLISPENSNVPPSNSEGTLPPSDPISTSDPSTPSTPSTPSDPADPSVPVDPNSLGCLGLPDMLMLGFSNSAFAFSGNSAVNGDVVFYRNVSHAVGSNVTVTGKFFLPLGVVPPATSSGVTYGFFDDADAKEAAVKALVSNLDRFAPTSTLTSILAPLTIHGNGGVNIVQVTNGINLSSSSVLTLAGTAQDVFIVKVPSVKITANAGIQLGEQVSPKRVVFIVDGTGDALSLTGQGIINGTFVVRNGDASISGGFKMTGSFLLGHSVGFSGGSATGESAWQAASFCTSTSGL